MNRSYNTTTTLIRSVSAIAATLVSLAIGSFIATLAHTGGEPQQVATTSAAVRL